MIEVKDIRKSFGDVAAVGGISFGVDKGEIFGLLGPNGAGKTTTISIICGLLKADSGSVKIAGIDIATGGRGVRRMMGVVPQEIALYEELSGRENLHFWGGLYGLSGGELRDASARVLEMVGLTERAGDPVREYSGGMKRRINLCAGLIHDPEIVLLDEPTLGIDPQARIRILEIVKDLSSRGTTVIYTTHYLEEAQSLCDRIAIIDRGVIHAEGSLDELTRLAGGEIMVTIGGGFDMEAAGLLLEKIKLEAVFKRVNVDHLGEGTIRVLVPGRETVGALLERFFAGGIQVEDISIIEPSLQSVFLKLTGRELRD